MPVLLPCPFCGGAAVTTKLDDEDEAECLGFLYVAGCRDLECPAMPTSVGDTPAQAAAAWNTRKNGGAA